MQVERISADITLKHKPKTGTQAYNMLIESLKAEIEEKQEILSHLSQDKVKQKFIENWNPTTRSVKYRHGASALYARAVHDSGRKYGAGHGAAEDVPDEYGKGCTAHP